MSKKCPISGNISFPIRTTIKDFTPFIPNLLKENPKLSITSIEREKNPSFEDSRRFSGIIDEPSRSATLTYNSNDYIFSNAQICLATHKEWIPKKNSTDFIQNKIDIIMIFEIETPIIDVDRFVFIVLPLIIDSTISDDNIYLQGLTYDIADVSFKVDYLLSGLTKFMYYTTCLEPAADKAFVYVSIEGILITQTLYQDLLAVWRNTGQSDIQNAIKKSLSQISNTNDNLVKIRSSKDLHANARAINNYNRSLNPLIDSTYENWPAFVPPYDVKINLTNRYITDSMLNLTNEGFQTYTTVQGDTYVSVTNAGGIDQSVSLQRTVNGALSPAIQLNIESDGSLQAVSRNTNQMQCIPLDADNAIDKDGNIRFNAEGSIDLSSAQAARTALRSSTNINTNYKDIEKYVGAALGGITILAGIILGITIYNNRSGAAAAAVPTNKKNLFPHFTSDLGFYSIIILIFTFSGFLIGAAVVSSY